MYSGDRSPDLAAGKREKRDEKISVSDQMTDNSDSFAVGINPFPHRTEKDFTTSNSRVTLQRNLSRKGSVRNGDRKLAGNDGDAVATSPRASSLPEKPRSGVAGPTEDYSHHHITIGGGGSPPAAGGAVAESKSVGRKMGFWRMHPMRIGDPKRILVFFATLSSVGTILLIYFTLSMAKHNRDDTASI